MESQLPQHPLDNEPQPLDDSSEASNLLSGLSDVTLRYRLESGPSHSTWIVDCGYQTAGALEIQAGPYTLTQYTESTPAAIKAAERLCSLPTHPSVLRVDAVTSSPKAEHIWYEAAEAGTLADYCRARGQLPLSQVTTIARSLTDALSYIHSQELAYQRLNATHCVFTVKGELKLLAPDLDLRTSQETTQQSKKAEDIAACAAILWFCLTGKEPKAQRLRAPLVLSVPQVSDALAQTLEDAIDLRAKQPSLSDIAAIFDLSADSAPLELHLSAHESVLSRLPAYSPPLEKSSKPGLVRGSKVYGKPRNLNVKPTNKIQAALKLNTKSRLARLIIAFTTLGALALASLYFFTGDKHNGIEAKSQDLVATESSLGAGQPDPVEPSGTLGEAAQNLPSPNNINADQSQALAQQATELISRRSEVLVSGRGDRIQEYALPGSELEQSDRILLSHDQAKDLAQMPSHLLSVDAVTPQADGSFTVTAVIEASGYKPQENETELATLGITKQGDRVTQKVNLTLQESEQGFRIQAARPIALSQG